MQWQRLGSHVQHLRGPLDLSDVLNSPGCTWCSKLITVYQLENSSQPSRTINSSIATSCRVTQKNDTAGCIEAERLPVVAGQLLFLWRPAKLRRRTNAAFVPVVCRKQRPLRVVMLESVRGQFHVGGAVQKKRKKRKRNC